MQTTSGAILLVIGVVALFAAIVGGGVKIKEIEVGSVPSRWRQGLLALFGLVVGGIGLFLVLPDSEAANAGSPQENVAPGDDNASAADTGSGNAASDESVVAAPADENAGAENQDGAAAGNDAR
jgi:hypothetical protein